MSESTYDIIKRQADKSGSCCGRCTYGHCCIEPVFVVQAEVEHALKSYPDWKLKRLRVLSRDWMEKAKASGLLEIPKEDGEDKVKTRKDYRFTYAYRWREMKLFCPFFEFGQCGIYIDRPGACAMFFVKGEPEGCGTDRGRFIDNDIGDMPIQFVSAVLFERLKACGQPERIICDHLGVILHNILFATDYKSAEHDEGYAYYDDDGIELTKERRQE